MDAVGSLRWFVSCPDLEHTNQLSKLGPRLPINYCIAVMYSSWPSTWACVLSSLLMVDFADHPLSVVGVAGTFVALLGGCVEVLVGVATEVAFSPVTAGG